MCSHISHSWSISSSPLELANTEQVAGTPGICLPADSFALHAVTQLLIFGKLASMAFQITVHAIALKLAKGTFSFTVKL